MLKKETKGTSEAMNRFEITLLMKVVKRMKLEETVRKKIIKDIMSADKQLKSVFWMMEQEKNIR